MLSLTTCVMVYGVVDKPTAFLIIVVVVVIIIIMLTTIFMV